MERAQSLGQELHSMMSGQPKGDLLSYRLTAIDKVDISVRDKSDTIMKVVSKRFKVLFKREVKKKKKDFLGG